MNLQGRWLNSGPEDQIMNEIYYSSTLYVIDCLVLAVADSDSVDILKSKYSLARIGYHSQQLIVITEEEYLILKLKFCSEINAYSHKKPTSDSQFRCSLVTPNSDRHIIFYDNIIELYTSPGSNLNFKLTFTLKNELLKLRD